MRPRPVLPAEIEDHRDAYWRREGARSVSSARAAEQFVEDVGFAACLTDARRPGPSLYVAVCGRRDAVLPRNVQTDHEASLAWTLKDEVLRRGQVYYGKLAGGRAMFVAPRLIPCFHALWGVRRRDEAKHLSPPARAVLRVLRREWEMASGDLRAASRIGDRTSFSRALDELQAAMLVVPSDVLYRPSFTYLWTLAIGRFPDGLRGRVSRTAAVREIARCFLAGAGLTTRGELARVSGLSRRDAGLGHHALVAEGHAMRVAPGCYRLTASLSDREADEDLFPESDD